MSGFPIPTILSDGTIQLLQYVLMFAIESFQINVLIHISDAHVIYNSSIIVNYEATTIFCSSETLIKTINQAVLTQTLTRKLQLYGFPNISATILPSLIAESSKPTLSPTSSPTDMYPKTTRGVAHFCLVKVNERFAYPFIHHYGSKVSNLDANWIQKCDCNGGTGNTYG